MRFVILALMLAVAAMLDVAAVPARADIPAPPSSLSPGEQCRAAIRAAERANGIPDQLMAAIGVVESGRRTADGKISPWPWSINAEGTDFVYESKQEVMASVRNLQAKGVRSIDVGCMQVNLKHHPNAFASLDQAFDPVENARYAARFLTELKAQTGSWEKATAWYHSATPALGEPYQQKVMAQWPREKQRGYGGLPDNPASTMTNRSVVASNGVRGGGFMLSNHAEAARILPSNAAGRGLAAYRASPIAVTGHGFNPAPL
jgi:hypothetical protein